MPNQQIAEDKGIILVVPLGPRQLELSQVSNTTQGRHGQVTNKQPD